jgi:hypothetical protein
MKRNKNNTIIIYFGQFYGIHRSARVAYNAMVDMVGEDHVYIATSERIDLKDVNFIPFGIKKDLIAAATGAALDHVVQSSRNHIVSEIFNQIEEDVADYIVLVAMDKNEKDKLRIDSVDNDGNKSYFISLPTDSNYVTGNDHAYPLPVSNYVRNVGILAANEMKRIAEDDQMTHEDKFTKFESISGIANQELFDRYMTALLARPLVTSLIGHGINYTKPTRVVEDLALTFEDLKNVLYRMYHGTLDIENGVTERLNGVNIFVSLNESGDVIFARNKGSMVNNGQHSLTIKELEAKEYVGGPGVKETFIEILEQFEVALGKCNDKVVRRIFRNGKRWLSLELVHAVWNKKTKLIKDNVTYVILNAIAEFDRHNEIQRARMDFEDRLFEELVEHLDKSIEIREKMTINTTAAALALDRGKHSTMMVQLTEFMTKHGLSDQMQIADYMTDVVRRQLSKWETDFNFNLSTKFKAGLIKRAVYGTKIGLSGLEVLTSEIKENLELYKCVMLFLSESELKRFYEAVLTPLNRIMMTATKELLSEVESNVTADVDSIRIMYDSKNYVLTTLDS